MSIESYGDLRVWREAMDLAEVSYRFTGTFPRDEIYGMTSQIRRVQFLRVAQGSLKELETHLLLSELLNLSSGESVKPLLSNGDTVGRMLRSLIGSMENSAG